MNGEMDARSILVLDVRETWPPHILDLLQTDDVSELLRTFDFMDDVEMEPVLRSIFAAVDEHAAKVGVAAFHCTKQVSERKYEQVGLRPLKYQTHYRDIRAHLAPYADPSMLNRIDEKFADAESILSGTRENMLHFVYTHHLAMDFGTEEFFRYFGGEATFRLFHDDLPVLELLQRIGEPVVVEFRVNPSELRLVDFELGKTLVASFAKSINGDFFDVDPGGWIERDVPPGDIVAVHQRRDFLAVATRLQGI